MLICCCIPGTIMWPSFYTPGTHTLTTLPLLVGLCAWTTWFTLWCTATTPSRPSSSRFPGGLQWPSPRLSWHRWLWARLLTSGPIRSNRLATNATSHMITSRSRYLCTSPTLFSLPVSSVEPMSHLLRKLLAEVRREPMDIWLMASLRPRAKLNRDLTCFLTTQIIWFYLRVVYHGHYSGCQDFLFKY